MRQICQKFKQAIIPLCLCLLALWPATHIAPLSAQEAASEKFSWRHFPWQAQGERSHRLIGKIWSLKEQKFITVETLTRQLATQKYIALGEIHDNPDHHILQAWLINEISQKGKRKPAIVMEMITSAQKQALQKYQSGQNLKASGLGKALNWSRSGWPKWSLYQPIASTAFANGLKIYAGNPDKKLDKKVGRKGFETLDTPEKNRLYLNIPLPKILSDDLGRQIVDSHCNMIPPSATTPMKRVQRLRDAVMADNLRKAAGKDGAILIAGSGHVRLDRGVPWYIAQSGQKVTSIMMAEALAGETDPVKLVSAAPEGYQITDYIWITPRMERPDPCEEFRKMMKNKHKPR